jgi:hypothetical protein
MKPVLEGLGRHLKECFFKSWKTTVTGLAFGVATETVSYLQNVPLSPLAHLVVGVVAAMLVSYKGEAK